MSAEPKDGLAEAFAESNREIGMAIGVLMGRGAMTEDQAFAQLRRASQYLNLKLRDVAVQVVETGRLPNRHDRAH
jgi:AmiR/NasT family two-component response regulator